MPYPAQQLKSEQRKEAGSLLFFFLLLSISWSFSNIFSDSSMISLMTNVDFRNCYKKLSIFFMCTSSLTLLNPQTTNNLIFSPFYTPNFLSRLKFSEDVFLFKKNSKFKNSPTVDGCRKERILNQGE